MNFQIFQLSVLIFVLQLKLTLSVTDLFNGPSCTVTPLVSNNIAPTYTSTSMQGSCNSIISCRALSGTSLGRCPGANVCCAYVRTCDQRTSHNHTYFVNPLYPAPVTGTNSCALTVYRPFKYRICQLRLDFLEFDVNRPLSGNCESDRLVISGLNANSVVPTLCGRNNGQHIYVDVENLQGPITIRMLTSGIGNRRWNIHISQIECTNPSRAPQNCLQYYTGPRGTFQSFNYESTRIPPQITTPAPGNQPTDASYLNGMDYAICFRKEAGFCSQTYTNNGTRDEFQIINQERDGTERTPNTQANAGLVKCPNDYLILGGIRFCGMYLNIDGLQRDTVVTNAPVIDSTRGPFIARFVTDSHSTRRGFQLSYHQNPCGSFQPTVPITPVAGG